MIFYIMASISVILTGIAKAGFGGGVGIAATPILILVVPSKEALGIMLPILCFCDWFAVYHYRKTFDLKNLTLLIPGAIIGIALASFFLLGLIPEKPLQVLIGCISILFVIYQACKTWIFKKITSYRPLDWHGWLYGISVGITSTLAHAGGPPATMFLLPQNMGRQLFVGTTVWLFLVVNAVKLVPYFYYDMINLERITTSITLLPLVPIGIWLGVWMNRNLSEKMFNQVIYTILVLIGLKLITGADPIQFLAQLWNK